MSDLTDLSVLNVDVEIALNMMLFFSLSNVLFYLLIWFLLKKYLCCTSMVTTKTTNSQSYACTVCVVLV